ncbi:hypothetical protein MRX96_002218 [Rhipicephalus microplus]
MAVYRSYRISTIYDHPGNRPVRVAPSPKCIPETSPLLPQSQALDGTLGKDVRAFGLSTLNHVLTQRQPVFPILYFIQVALHATLRREICVADMPILALDLPRLGSDDDSHICVGPRI